MRELDPGVGPLQGNQQLDGFPWGSSMYHALHLFAASKNFLPAGTHPATFGEVLRPVVLPLQEHGQGDGSNRIDILG